MHFKSFIATGIITAAILYLNFLSPYLISIFFGVIFTIGLILLGIDALFYLGAKTSFPAFFEKIAADKALSHFRFGFISIVVLSVSVFLLPDSSIIQLFLTVGILSSFFYYIDYLGEEYGDELERLTK